VSETGQKVAIVTGGSQGIGAGLVDGYRQRLWAVVANSRDIRPSKDPVGLEYMMRAVTCVFS
jgi:NAD(P)-dependent dehydrogenase (short-subunit alcohol dehydrogenase family)